MYIYIYIYIQIFSCNSPARQQCIYIYIYIYKYSLVIPLPDNNVGWLRSVRSFKLQVSCTEYCLFYRALLQKKPIILSILLTEATSFYTYKGIMSHMWMGLLAQNRHRTEERWMIFSCNCKLCCNCRIHHVTHTKKSFHTYEYGVAMTSRHLTIVGLFCRI